MRKINGLLIFATMLLSCNSSETKSGEEKTKLPLEGTWELLSGTTIQKNDTTVTDYTKGQQMIKIINATHFAFLRHDLSKGKDTATAVYSSGGGSYSLDKDQYTEHLDYCSDREWEGHTFPFTVLVTNDTLVQTGVEKVEGAGVDRLIIEKYKRVKSK